MSFFTLLRKISKAQNWIWVGLFFSFTNILYFSVLPALIAYVYFPIRLFSPKNIQENLKNLKKIQILWIILFLYIFFSGVIYNWHQFLQFDFFRRDGNLFLSYSPFLFLYFLNFSKKTTKKNLTLFSIFLIGIYLIYFIFSSPELPYRQNSFLFSSTAAAGGFISLILAFFIFTPLQIDRRIKVLILAGLCIFLIFTGSRASFLSLIIAVALTYLYYKSSFFKILPVLLLMGGFLSVVILSSAKESQKIVQDVLKEFGYQKKSNDNLRMKVYWPKAVDGFLENPLFGKGLGSYNDYDYVCLSKNGSENIIQYKYPGIYLVLTCNQVTGYKHSGKIRNNSEHAHNSYLQILYELGLIGFLLFILFLIEIYRIIIQHGGIFQQGLLCSFWVIAFSSLVENRFTAPSVLIPFSLLLLVCFCLQKNNEKIDSETTNLRNI